VPRATPSLASCISTDARCKIGRIPPSTGRLLEILELLQSRPVVSGAQIAERLGVDRRTVRRYVAALQELDIPVEGERGIGGGYRLRAGYRLPPLMLSPQEAAAVVLALSAARGAGLGESEAADAALGKLRRVLPERLRRKSEALETAVEFTARVSDPVPAPTAIVLLLAEAIYRRRRVRLDYRAFDGRRSSRELSPHGLVVHAGRWYLIGRDHGRRAQRTFRVDRISRPELLSTDATAVPDGFVASEELMRSLARVPWRWDVEVVLALPVEEARRRVAGSLAEIEQTRAGTVLRLRAESLDWTAALLAGLGCAFTVRRPDELRASLAVLAERLRAA
jgi:predicted DNA-binding transcriptional regulator YafY